LRLFCLLTKRNDNINEGNKESKMNKSDLINEVAKVVGAKKYELPSKFA